MSVPEGTTQETQTTDELDLMPSTDALKQVSRPLYRRTPAHGKRGTAQLRDTDASIQVSGETTGTRAAWRQAVQLREENRRLRLELEEQRTEFQRLVAEYTALQAEYDQEIAVIHSGHKRENEQYQQHLQELISEKKQLQETNAELQQRYQELSNSFQSAVKSELDKMLVEAVQTVELPAEQASAFLQDMKKTITLQVQQEGDQHLLETLYLKREVQRLATLLETERHDIAEERQRLFALQSSIRQQAEVRYKAVQDGLKARWKVATVLTACSAIVALVVLQFVGLHLLHIQVVPQLSLAIIGPIIACVLLAIVLSGPLSRTRFLYKGAPHKRKVKQS